MDGKAKRLMPLILVFVVVVCPHMNNNNDIGKSVEIAVGSWSPQASSGVYIAGWDVFSRGFSTNLDHPCCSAP